MRKAYFWSVLVLLAVVLAASSYFWVQSYNRSYQTVVRYGTPSLTVATIDRGRVGLLFLRDRPSDRKWVFEMKSAEAMPADAPKLESFCESNGLGFGMGKDVRIVDLERPAVAVAGLDDPQWAARRMVLPFWVMSVGSLALLILWVVRVGIPMHRAEHGLCPKCSYDISECSHFCPKCRRPIDKRSWSGDVRPASGMLSGG
jgi:hypothetical protein